MLPGSRRKSTKDEILFRFSSIASKRGRVDNALIVTFAVYGGNEQPYRDAIKDPAIASNAFRCLRDFYEENRN